MNVELLQRHSPWQEQIHFFESIDSTNTHALQLGESGAVEGTIVIADEQTKGRGQFHRPWFSPAGAGIWMSLLLRPKLVPELIPALSHFAAVALYDVMATLGVPLEHLKIKEPNDLLIANKKVAGILVETRIGKSSFVVVGIGLNVFQQHDEFPLELREKVTSLALVLGKKNLNRETLLITVMEKLYDRYQQLLHQPAELDLDWVSRVCL